MFLRVVQRRQGVSAIAPQSLQRAFPERRRLFDCQRFAMPLTVLREIPVIFAICVGVCCSRKSSSTQASRA